MNNSFSSVEYKTEILTGFNFAHLTRDFQELCNKMAGENFLLDSFSTTTGSAKSKNYIVAVFRKDF